MVKVSPFYRVKYYEEAGSKYLPHKCIEGITLTHQFNSAQSGSFWHLINGKPENCQITPAGRLSKFHSMQGFYSKIQIV